MIRSLAVFGAAVLFALCSTPRAAAGDFFHFESPHVHPLELTPDGAHLLAVNTVDARLEVFGVIPKSPHLTHLRSIPVGLEPVSVRARTNSEAWIVNHVSDSITVVDIESGFVRATIVTGDEPCDVVFAGTAGRAFVTLSQRNRIAVYDPSDLAAAPAIIAIEGEDPRALVTDGSTVYAAIFECGNDTTIIDAAVVSSPLNPYPGDPNPPPNSTSAAPFSPALNTALPTPPQVSHIVRKGADGRWYDELGTDWTPAVGWGLHGHDLAAIDADSLSVSYRAGLMTTPMALALRPDGDLVAVGTEALNQVRFEPRLNGVFLRVEARVLDPVSGTIARFDLNPHLDYAINQLPPDQRRLGLGDPRGVALSPDGSTAYVTGMGSSNVVAISLATGGRIAMGESGEGPTGIVLDAAGDRLFTLNRFDGSVSVLKPESLGELSRIGFFDPTPAALRNGRPFLYDTHISSGLGIVSCASCHVDGRMDQLAWDLGDPSGTMKAFDQTCDFGASTACGDWHPMKGPMMTQTLLGLKNDEPFHWRGDRANLAEFGHAAKTILSNDAEFSATEMARLEAYLASISLMPNPNRNLDHSLSTSVEGADGGQSGDAVLGESLFLNGALVGGANCNFCHANAKGGNSSVLNPLFAQQFQSVKVAHLTNMLEKTGFDKGSQANNRGFGFEHDGALGTMVEFLGNGVFTGLQNQGSSLRKHVAAFMFSFDTGTHSAIGAQVTLGGANPGDVARRNLFLSLADAGVVDVVARMTGPSGTRSFAYMPAPEAGKALFQSDVLAEALIVVQLDDLTSDGVTVTYTVVPDGTGQALLDRDGDGHFDGDELASCTDPADPRQYPGGTCRYDIAGADGVIDGQDLATLLSAWGSSNRAADVDCSGTVDAADLAFILSSWGDCF